MDSERDVAAGLCASCSHVRTIRSPRGSTFYRCALSDKDPRFAKYPRLPVLRCEGWTLQDTTSKRSRE